MISVLHMSGLSQDSYSSKINLVILNELITSPLILIALAA